jgi:hypothetical protein
MEGGAQKQDPSLPSTVSTSIFSTPELWRLGRISFLFLLIFDGQGFCVGQWHDKAFACLIFSIDAVSKDTKVVVCPCGWLAHFCTMPEESPKPYFPANQPSIHKYQQA